MAGSLEREEGCPLSLACGQTAPPKGEPSRGVAVILTTFKEGSLFARQSPCLSLWERWHGEAVTERVFPGPSNLSIAHTPKAPSLRELAAP